MPIDHSAYLSPIAQKNPPDGIRGLFPLETEGVISFLAGRPNPDSFPFESLSLHLKAPLGHPGQAGLDLKVEGADMVQALSYGSTSGLPALNKFCSSFTSTTHARSISDPSWRVTIGSGCQDLLSKAFHTLIGPGDQVLVEAPTYAGVLSIFDVLDCDLHEVAVDQEGLSPKDLRRVLAEWPEGLRRPKMIYTVPVGSNPTGCSSSAEKKLEILQICLEHGILLIEDDPYYFLTTNPIPSYFELETQVIPEGGLVLRFDSFSKVLSSGVRLGWASGPRLLIDKMDQITGAVNLQPNSFAQAVVWALLKEWGMDGFISHAKRVAIMYEERRVWFEELAHKHLDGLATWVSPVAGMFLFINIAPLDSEAFTLSKALSKGVLAVPGHSFYPSGCKSTHLRVAFSIIDKASADEGFRRLASAIREAKAELK